MDKPRVRKNHNRRFDSLQYLKLAVHNSWKLTPKVAAAKNIESKNDIYKNNSSSSSPATGNTREIDFSKKSLDGGVDNKIKATMANGCTFYYSVQDTVIKNDFSDEDSDDEDDEDVITDHLSKSGYEIIPGSDSLENRVSGIINNYINIGNVFLVDEGQKITLKELHRFKFFTLCGISSTRHLYRKIRRNYY